MLMVNVVGEVLQMHSGLKSFKTRKKGFVSNQFVFLIVK